MADNQKIEQHVLDSYQLIKKLGSGAYGHVWKVKSKKTGAVLALKKIFDAFQHATDAQRTFREISILKQLRHDKIVKLEDVMAAKNDRDIYLIFEYMESDLYHLVYESKLQSIHIKYIIYQIVLALHYLHLSKLIHRDLKPSNILVNSDCSAKICDFGLVRFLGSDLVNFNTLTEGVATRWYRSPEVLLGSNSYDEQADMWSMGCILAEVLLKSPLFPGTCTTNQLERIVQLTGQPSQSDIKSLRAELAEVMISEVCNGKVRKRTDILAKIEDKTAIDLIYKLLEFNPTKRLSAKECLKHKYFEEFFCEADFNIKGEDIVMDIDENIQLQTRDYLNIIKEKFIAPVKRLEKSPSRSKTRGVPESPKSFSDLKKSRLSNIKGDKQKGEKGQTSFSSLSKSRLKTTQNETSSRVTSTKDMNLFKELCNEKARQMSHKKESLSKENKAGCENSLNVRKEDKENVMPSFKSFCTVKKIGDDKKLGSFCGLKKTSKLVQR